MNDVSKFSIQSDVSKMAKTIQDVINIGESNGLTCWLNYGALLGMIRENRLLPWNNDAELCCWHEPGISQKFQIIVDELNSVGYACYYYSSIGAMSVRGEGVIVNVNCLWREGDNIVRPHENAAQAGYAPLISRVFYWIATFLGAYPSGFIRFNEQKISRNIVTKSVLVTILRIIPLFIRKKLFILMIQMSGWLGGKFKKTAIPAKYFNEFKKIEFYGGEVLVPEQSEGLLECIYGKEWNVPKENWSFYDKKNKNDTGVVFLNEKWNYQTMELL